MSRGCGACNNRKQECPADCLYAPFFPPHQEQKYANIYQVFGEYYLTNRLPEINADQLELATEALAFEAEARIRDPISGCTGIIDRNASELSRMQEEIVKMEAEIERINNLKRQVMSRRCSTSGSSTSTSTITTQQSSQSG